MQFSCRSRRQSKREKELEQKEEDTTQSTNNIQNDSVTHTLAQS